MTNVIERQTPTFAELNELRKTLDPSSGKRSSVDFSEAQAISYVWGRQDAGESARDTGYSIDFGRAYALHEARYQAGLIGCRHSIRDAFERWSKGEPIEQ